MYSSFSARTVSVAPVTVVANRQRTQKQMERVDHEQRHGTSLVTAPPDDARERERDGCRDEEDDVNRVYPVVHTTLSV
jgi:hypothetical protein